MDGKAEMGVKTKIVGWVKTLCVQDKQSAARDKWKPPNQGRTTPSPRSRSAGRHEALPVPTCPTLQLHRLLAPLLHQEPLLFTHSHGSLSLQGHLREVRPFFKTEFKCYLLSSRPLAPKHCGFSSAVAFIMTSLFDWRLFPCLLNEMKISFKKPIPSLSIFVSPQWLAQCRAYGRCLSMFCVKLNWLYQNSTPSNECTYNTHDELTRHDLVLMECKGMSWHSGG